MKRLLYIATLSLVASLLFAPAAMAQADPCPDPNFPRETPDGCQASSLPDVQLPDDTTGTVPQAAPTAPATPAQPQAPAMTDLPETGGPALLLPAAGLLLGAGLFGMRMVRRRF